MKRPHIEDILLDPASFYAAPREVLVDEALTEEQKLKILSNWEYNASEEAVALEEGMPGEETGTLREILVALEEIVGPIDAEHTGPTKQHGLTHLGRKQH